MGNEATLFTGQAFLNSNYCTPKEAGDPIFRVYNGCDYKLHLWYKQLHDSL